ncbi:MAG: hypothetical protein FWG02_10855 [Holophagaceae bacterium]|nr:hypothetical protein [Holophagaceae bacterium]
MFDAAQLSPQAQRIPLLLRATAKLRNHPLIETDLSIVIQLAHRKGFPD